jgi:hypothetical protein
MRENAWLTLIVTIHRRPGNCRLGMCFVHNWLRKRPYTLCRSCRGIGDLQLCYSPLGPLLLKNLEQNTVEQGQVGCFKSVAPRVRAHARRRARGHASLCRRPTEHNCQCTAATAGPTGSTRQAQGHWTVLSPPFSPTPLAPRVRPPRCLTTGVAAVRRLTLPPPCARTMTCMIVVTSSPRYPHLFK